MKLILLSINIVLDSVDVPVIDIYRINGNRT